MTILFGKRRVLRKIGSLGSWVEDLKKQVERTSTGDVIFDISTAITINSEELSALTEVHLVLARQDRSLRLVNAQPQVEEVFEITRMNRLILVSGLFQEQTGYRSALKVAQIAR